MGCDRGEECREVHTMIDRAEPFPPPLPASRMPEGVRGLVRRHRMAAVTGGPEARGPFGCRRGSGGG